MLKLPSRTVSAVLLGSFLLLAFASADLLWALSRVDQASMLVVQTYEVIGKAEALLSATKDAETGQRGYLITGDRQYLAPYERAAVELPQAVSEIHQLVVGNSEQAQRLARIERLVEEKRQELAQTIALAEA